MPSNERRDTTKQWSVFDVNKGARTVTEIEEYSKKPKARRMGCCKAPIFKIDYVMIDTLHLYLRISDVLIDLLIQDLRKLDGITATSHFANVTACEELLNDCKI